MSTCVLSEERIAELAKQAVAFYVSQRGEAPFGLESLLLMFLSDAANEGAEAVRAEQRIARKDPDRSANHG